MIHRPITIEDYDLILSLDRKVYPTPFPVNREIISSWYINNPEFGTVFEEDGKYLGVCIAIPLNEKGWKLLIDGKLKESEMTSGYIFNNERDNTLGIHIYHMEKLGNTKHFYLHALAALRDTVDK
jgi:hypothetical protein